MSHFILPSHVKFVNDSNKHYILYKWRLEKSCKHRTAPSHEA